MRKRKQYPRYLLLRQKGGKKRKSKEEREGRGIGGRSHVYKTITIKLKNIKSN